jgi:hypothetical protein
MRSRRRVSAEAHGCARRRVAESVLGSVDACACGMLHVNVGAFTMRLERAALEELCGMLRAALERRDESHVTEGWTSPRARGEA